MRKIQVVPLEEESTVASQIHHWEADGWRFQGFMRRAEGIWARPQAVFEMDIGLM